MAPCGHGNSRLVLTSSQNKTAWWWAADIAKNGQDGKLSKVATLEEAIDCEFHASWLRGRSLGNGARDSRVMSATISTLVMFTNASLSAGRISSLGSAEVITYIAHSCTVIAAAADASLGVWKMRHKTFKEAGGCYGGRAALLGW